MDTALSAKEIADKKMMDAAAISSAQAAERYNLEIIAEGIETHKINYTRFLILQGQNGDHHDITSINKAS